MKTKIKNKKQLYSKSLKKNWRFLSGLWTHDKFIIFALCLEFKEHKI